MQKKTIKIFSNCKNKHAKKAWNNISKKDAKKAEMQKKKDAKKSRGGVGYIIGPITYRGVSHEERFS